MRAFRGPGVAIGLSLLAGPNRADACSAVEPESGVLVAPVFADDTQIERATLDVTCDELRCRFEAHYFLAPNASLPSRAAIALRGAELRVFAGRESPSHRVGAWRVVEFPVDSRKIEVTGSFPLLFGASPCVGPGYLARHRFLGTEGRPRVASFVVVVPDRAVPHDLQVKHPAGWGRPRKT